MPSILIVDDDRSMLDVFDFYLKEELPVPVNVVRSVDGMDALRKVGNQPFDLIITDNNMPRVEGLDFVKILREDMTKSEMNVKTPVILISGALKEGHVEEALELGIRHILAKPLDPERFKQTVRQALHLAP